MESLKFVVGYKFRREFVLLTEVENDIETKDPRSLFKKSGKEEAMRYIKLSDILELKSPYKELIETEANRIMEATGGIVVPEDSTQLIEEQNHRICLKLGCSKEFASVLGEIARCRAADLARCEGE